MTDGDITEDQHREILRRDILPLLFPQDTIGGARAFVLLSGQPGAGRSRAIAPLLAEHGGALAAVSGDELPAFHPAFRELSTARSADGARVLARASAGWVRDCIRYARENHRSLLLEGTFHDSAVATAIADRFAAAGFETRLVVVASRRAESLLTVVSRYLREVQADSPARYTSREAHDRGFDATRTLVAAVEDGALVNRLTILDRDGDMVFDARGSDRDDPFRGASIALAAAQSAPMSRFAATQWLSELHHVTQFARSRRDLPRGVTELLVDLHETSLREVIPELRIPADGKFATAMEQKTVANLVALRRSMQPAQQTDAAAPVIVPGGPERGGPSR
ncbi:MULTISPECIES: zeta toxin family protein [Microbacterium]|uniref:zeta toxin family protein n=1 Tax=Microbacterium TaxID=33882 RepID=UPI0003DE23BA|nr:MULTISPECIES: zeta toxin family protein [Microbacterium]CDK01638.1 hypothetical protein MIC448_800006 [Microbacterium sp. C448]